ncbi:S-adenosylmethionine:tRNA ribosyltransferase-isomerase [Legionella micdadei]
MLAFDRLTCQCTHSQFKDIVEFLQPGDFLVMNNS